MKRKFFRLIQLLVMILITLFGLSSCYMDVPASSDFEPIFLNSRDAIGDAGDGYYLVVRVYEKTVMDNLLFGDPPQIEYSPGSYIYYEQSLPLAELVFAQYLGSGEIDTSGTLLVPFIEPGSYKLLVERGYYDDSSGLGFSINYAGVTNTINVNAGENVEVDIDLDTYGA